MEISREMVWTIIESNILRLQNIFGLRCAHPSTFHCSKPGLLEPGAGGTGPQVMADQTRGLSFPPHYYAPLRIFRPSDGPMGSVWYIKSAYWPDWCADTPWALWQVAKLKTAWSFQLIHVIMTSASSSHVRSSTLGQFSIVDLDAWSENES